MSISFYIAAHEDDWQLFRPSAAYDDLANDNNYVVFIMTTAGYAGTLDCWWRAREQGVIASIYSGLTRATTPNPPLPPTSAFTYTTKSINNKSIVQVEIVGPSSRSTLYLLRLPDGNGNGDGFPRTGNVSLLKLFNGSNNTIEPAVGPDCQLPTSFYTTMSIQQMTSLADDHGASVQYDGWQDLVDTIGDIIQAEMDGSNNATEAWMNFPDWCAQCSPGDHADHKATAYAVSQALQAPDMSTAYRFGRAEWPSYSVDSCERNLDFTQTQDLAVVCSAYVQASYQFILNNYPDCAFCVDDIGGGLLGGGDYEKWPDWSTFAGWQYCRLTQIGASDSPPADCGPCGTSTGVASENFMRKLEKETQHARDFARRRPTER